MSVPKHPPYYNAIRDGIVAKMGARFDETEYRRLFPRVASEYGVIPCSDGYLAHRRIIKGLVKAKVRRMYQVTPKVQLQLV